jgi:hypothetical protein
MPTTYAIIKGNQYMDATLYTGTGATVSIVNAGGFEPDLLWIKQRSTGITQNHTLWDTNRNISGGFLVSNNTDAAANDGGGVTAFNSNGWTMGASDGLNQSTKTFVGWQWAANQGANVTNTTGTITSTVSANTTAGFSIVTYTGQNSDGTVGHGLGAVPQFIVIKNRSTTTNWVCYHVSTGNTGATELSTTSAFYVKNYWQNTTPTSSVFSLAYNAGNNAGVLTSGSTYVAYCWTPIPGFSAFGSYTGNGSTDGPFIYTGFRPKYLLIKSSTDATNGEWVILDTSRSTYNANGDVLKANTAQAESAYTGYIDILSNGFKLRNNVAGSWTNNNGQTYIYAAFAETPFKYANAR